MPVTEIKSQDDYEKLLKKYKVVIINANASWAGPCKAMSPIYDRLSNQIPYNPEYFALAKLDIDEVYDLAEKLGVHGVPFFMAYEDGKRKDNILMPSPSTLQKFLISWSDKAHELGKEPEKR
ncbi:Thioredoxin [Fusarium oxysporum f. sp. cubense]|uniref:Thioredoxin n=1 Tax=Fusarium oxysporum f. sp. cubense TaxID=61366 RepID=A0A559LKZ1_FUSOC|nr:Thioredoxin [Fusarium oxysporum f. sp. cubense]